MRLSDLANIKNVIILTGLLILSTQSAKEANRGEHLIEKTGRLFKVYSGDNYAEGNVWGIGTHGINTIIS